MYSNPVVLQDLAQIAEDCFDQNSLSQLNGKNVMITGATGLIGSYILMSLMYANDQHDTRIKLFPTSRRKQKMFEKLGRIEDRKDITALQMDISEDRELSIQPDVVIHAASPTDPRTFTESPQDIVKANVLGTLKLLELLKQTGAKGKFLLLSTREIYGTPNPGQTFVTEDDYGAMDPTEARSCYPESKRLAENLCSLYREQFGTQCTIVRIAHTYGPGMTLNDGRVLGDIFGAAIRGQNIALKSDGRSKLVPTYISDVISGIFKAFFSNDNWIFNVGSQTEIKTVFEFATDVAAQSHGPLQVVGASGGHPGKGYLSQQPGFLECSRLRKAGWTTTVDSKAGISKTLTFYKEVIGGSIGNCSK